jgi:uncharacterized RDD family membrane protein YckC
MSKKGTKVVKNKTVLTAPLLKRLGAFILDFIFLYLIFIVVITLSNTLINIDEFQAIIGFGFYMLLFLIGVAYHLVIPLYAHQGENQGQTFGKRIMKIKIIKTNGEAIDLKSMLIRVIFTVLVEGLVIAFSTLYFFQALVFIGFPVGWTIYLLSAYLTITFVSIILTIIRPSHQMLHDYVAQTVVILVDQKV